MSRRTHDSARIPAPRQEHFVFEATQRCNHACLHCYNAWKNPLPYPEGELGTGETLRMLGKMLDETGASLVTLTGGEPLLRRDIYDIVEFLVGRGVTINLISIGTLLNEKAISRLSRRQHFVAPLGTDITHIVSQMTAGITHGRIPAPWPAGKPPAHLPAVYSDG